MSDETKLTFKVHQGETNELKTPRWRPVEVDNAKCPNDGELMIVVLGHDGILYAYCLKCKQYFVGE